MLTQTIIKHQGVRLFLFALIILCSLRCSDQTFQNNEEWLFSEIDDQFWKMEEIVSRDLIILKSRKFDKEIKDKINSYNFIDESGHELITKVKQANEIDHKLYQNICSFLNDVGYHIKESDIRKFQTIFNSVINKDKNLNKFKVITLIRLSKFKVFQSVFKGVNT